MSLQGTQQTNYLCNGELTKHSKDKTSKSKRYFFKDFSFYILRWVYLMQDSKILAEHCGFMAESSTLVMDTLCIL